MLNLRFVSSWDDGGVEDMRLAQLLKKYNLPAIFFIPTCSPLRDKDIKELNKDFEIGGHTVSHPQDLQKLSREEMIREIVDNKIWLEETIGYPVTKFCYPRGRYNDEVTIAVQAAGFTSARTTKVLQTKYSNPFQMPTSIHVFQRDEYKGKDWVEVARGMVLIAAQTNGIFHLWGHSAEISKWKNWEKLEAFFKWLVENYKIVKGEAD
mgnify:CR=1 FL=1